MFTHVNERVVRRVKNKLFNHQVLCGSDIKRLSMGECSKPNKEKKQACAD